MARDTNKIANEIRRIRDQLDLIADELDAGAGEQASVDKQNQLVQKVLARVSKAGADGTYTSQLLNYFRSHGEAAVREALAELTDNGLVFQDGRRTFLAAFQKPETPQEIAPEHRLVLEGLRVAMAGPFHTSAGNVVARVGPVVHPNRVRSALRELASWGLAQFDAGRGVIITKKGHDYLKGE